MQQVVVAVVVVVDLPDGQTAATTKSLTARRPVAASQSAKLSRPVAGRSSQRALYKQSTSGRINYSPSEAHSNRLASRRMPPAPVGPSSRRTGPTPVGPLQFAGRSGQQQMGHFVLEHSLDHDADLLSARRQQVVVGALDGERTPRGECPFCGLIYCANQAGRPTLSTSPLSPPGRHKFRPTRGLAANISSGSPGQWLRACETDSAGQFLKIYVCSCQRVANYHLLSVILQPFLVVVVVVVVAMLL